MSAPAQLAVYLPCRQPWCMGTVEVLVGLAGLDAEQRRARLVEEMGYRYDCVTCAMIRFAMPPEQRDGVLPAPVPPAPAFLVELLGRGDVGLVAEQLERWHAANEARYEQIFDDL